MKKTILITHTDLDGAACVIVAKEFFKDNIEYYCCNPNKCDDVFQYIIDYWYKTSPFTIDKVIFADICPKNIKSIQLISKYSINTEIYDHHLTNMNFILSLKHLPETLKYFFSVDECCGALNFYKNSPDKQEDNNELAEFLRYINNYDLHIDINNISDGYNLLLQAIGMDRFLARSYAPLSVEEQYIISGLVHIRQQYIKNKLKHIRSIYFLGFNLVIYITESTYIDALADVLKTEYSDKYDGLIMINLDAGSVSIRAIKETFDCAKFVRRLSKLSGGHVSSAAFMLSPKVNNYIINNILLQQLRIGGSYNAKAKKDS